MEFSFLNLLSDWGKFNSACTNDVLIEKGFFNLMNLEPYFLLRKVQRNLYEMFKHDYFDGDYNQLISSYSSETEISDEERNRKRSEKSVIHRFQNKDFKIHYYDVDLTKKEWRLMMKDTEINKQVLRKVVDDTLIQFFMDQNYNNGNEYVVYAADYE